MSYFFLLCDDKDINLSYYLSPLKPWQPGPLNPTHNTRAGTTRGSEQCSLHTCNLGDKALRSYPSFIIQLPHDLSSGAFWADFFVEVILWLDIIWLIKSSARLDMPSKDMCAWSLRASSLAKYNLKETLALRSLDLWLITSLSKSHLLPF